MKRSEFIGWKDVFRFSFVQGVKQKAYYGFLIVMCLVILLWSPIAALINGGGEDEAYTSKVTKLTVYDETGLNIDYAEALQGDAYAGIQVVTDSSQGYDAHVKSLEESEDSTELIAKIVFDESGLFNLTFVKANSSPLTTEDCDSVAGAFVAYFEDARISAIDVTPEQMEFINQPVSTKVEFFTEAGEIIPQQEKKEGINMDEYSILYVGLVVTSLIFMLCGNSIANSIMTEKTTRVVEYLMINVRPMALIVGKLLASLLLVLIQVAAVGASYGLSVLLRNALFGAPVDDVESMGAEMGVSMGNIMQMLDTIQLSDAVIALIVIFAGIIFYGILAGLAGASISKMEEMAEGMKLFSLTVTVGLYIGLALTLVLLNGENVLFTNICCILPISAPFVVPACLILNKISLTVALISLGIMVVCTILLFSFTAKVYESMIFYNGSVLKIKDIIRIAKNRKVAERKEEKHE